MTFGAMAAWQAWLLVAAAGAAAAGLFLLKVLPPRVRVPSLLLWARVLSETREATLWERIRRAVSLVLTAAIAVFLALAVTRPSFARRGPAAAQAGSDRLLIVLDSSWTMLARTRSGETRWDRAVAEARRLAGSAAGRDVAVATTADGLVEGPSADTALIETAIDRLAPGGGEAGGWPRVPDAEVHFVTDGASARVLDRTVLVHSVFEAADNAGITAFDVRPSLEPDGDDQAYLEAANFGAPQQVRVTIVRGNATLLDRRVEMGAGETLRQVVRLPAGGAPDLRARIEAGRNALAADDEAVAWIRRAAPLSVVVVGADTAWLQPLFASATDVRPSFQAPGAYHPGTEDVVVFDRWTPAAPSARPALYIEPPAAAWLSRADQVEPHPKWAVPAPHALLDGVDVETFSVDRARVYQSPQLRAIARSAVGTPLIAVVDARGEPRAAVIAFGPLDSNLGAAPGLPVLIGNALDWLGRPLVEGARRPGRVTLDDAVLHVTGPGGDDVPLLKIGGATFASVRNPGLYTADSGGARATFAVNIADPDVSDLSKTTKASAAGAIVVKAGVSARPWWVYLVVVALVAALLEWWTWLRRITV
jgi:hypothetical protein